MIPPLDQPELTAKTLAENMSSFIFEVRKQDGSEFPPDSPHHIISGIQRFLRWNRKPQIDLFKDAEFADFRVCLDSEMKRLQRGGLGSKKKKAEPLTAEEEELLWTKGLLGSGSPQALLDTMVVMNGIYFALRSGSEHDLILVRLKLSKNQESVPTLCTRKTFQRIDLEASKVEN